jgi:fucose permease
VSAHFLVMGLAGGVWMARVPSAKAQVHLSDGTLGIALLAVPVGLVLGAALAERLVDRVGSAVLCRITGVGSCAAAVTPGLAHTLPELMAGLFAIGVFGGTLDVSQNAQGVRVEAAYGRRVMTSMHACYSLGAILGSLAGSAFALAGVGLLPSLAVVGVTGALIDGAAGPWLLPRTIRPAPAGPAPHESGAPQGQLYGTDGTPGQDALDLGAPRASSAGTPSAPSGTSVTENASDARKRVRRLVLALGVLGVCGLVGEGSAGDWSAVYLKDNLGASAAFAALGFAAFSVTMTLGRGIGDRLIQRFGVVRVVRVCGLLATIGLAAVLATPVPGVAIIGFTVFGAGLSVVVPQVFAAGGRADPFRPGSGLAKVVGLGYTGMAAGPAIIGLIADKIGLHLALFIPLALAAWIAVAASALHAPQSTDPIQSLLPASQSSV